MQNVLPPLAINGRSFGANNSPSAASSDAKRNVSHLHVASIGKRYACVLRGAIRCAARHPTISTRKRRDQGHWPSPAKCLLLAERLASQRVAALEVGRFVQAAGQ